MFLTSSAIGKCNEYGFYVCERLITIFLCIFNVRSAGVNKEATDSKNKGCGTVNIKDRSNKEVRKRLNFLNVDEKKIDPAKDNIAECHSEHLALTEEIMNHESRENASANVSMMNSTHRQSIMKTYMGDDEKVNDEDKTLDLNVDNFSEQANEEENIEAPLDDEEDVCDMTFTQYLSKKLESESEDANVLSAETTSDTTKDKLITITTKFNPPSRERIVNSMKMYDISGCKSTAPFFSNRVDLIKQKENSNKTSGISDSVPFKSSLERVTSIKLWRRVKINEFYPSGANIKSCNIKRVLAGYNSIVIQPLVQPPTPKCIRTWLRAKEYLLKKSEKHTEPKSDTKVEKTHSSDTNNEKTEERNTAIETIADKNEHAKVHSQTSNTSEYSSGSNHSLNPSLQKMLENPLLYKNKETQYLGISYGQIEYSMKGHTGNVADENLQNARGLTVVNI